jgi:hypothetical protein
LFVKENQAVVVTNSSVYVIDVDTSPDQLQLKVDVAPQHGMAVTTVFVEISFVVLFVYCCIFTCCFIEKCFENIHVTSELFH